MMNSYRFKTTEELIAIYADEELRANQADKEHTQALIKKELKRRFNAVINLLDDFQTFVNPECTYNYLLGK